MKVERDEEAQSAIAAWKLNADLRNRNIELQAENARLKPTRDEHGRFVKPSPK